jgi:uncharacterized protein (TIGR02266 family)
VERIDKRSNVRTPVTLIVDYEGAEDFLGDYTENLSRGGTFVLTSRQVEVDTTIKLVLSFPGLLAPISLEGIVRWTRGGEQPGLGIEFLDGAGRDRLAMIVERIEQRDTRIVARVLSVLVVEDNPHIAKLIQDGLEATGRREPNTDLAFTVSSACDGAAALQLLKAHHFDVAIVDVYLPIIQGQAVIHQARRELGLVGLPIIAVSGGGEGARAVALEAGATVFLDKPMRLRSMIESIRELTKLAL